jgi:hypothetical protein
MSPRFFATLSVLGFVVAWPACVRAASVDVDTAPPSVEFARLSQIDFPTLKARLEKAGWPASHVQAFVGLEIQRRLNPPEPEPVKELKPFEFWRTGPEAEAFLHVETSERHAERVRREEAARAQFDALFPPPSEPEDSKQLRAWEESRRWGGLSEEKRRAVADLLATAAQAKDAFSHSRGGMLTLEEEKQLDSQARQTRAALEKLLTPEELLDNDLRNSLTAGRMRSELDNFQPTRAEFVTIFQLRHPLELEFGADGLAHDEERARLFAEAEARVERAIADVLGPARYDDYRISREPACQSLQFVGRAAQMDAPAIRRLYRAFFAAQAALSETASLPEPERPAAQARIKADIHREFRLVLDEENTRRYLQEQSLWP